jgi:predicted nuclease of predicted toxin-antitoxin system
VKFLLDFNLSPKLVGMIDDLWPGSIHIRDAGFEGETPDEAIWQYARQNGFTILTADYDFLHLADRYGHPPKLIRLEGMNYPTQLAAELLRGHAVVISELEKSTKQGVLRLRARYLPDA